MGDIGRPVASLNLQASPHLLRMGIEAGCEPPPFRSSNTALSSRFSTCSGVMPARGPSSAGSYSDLMPSPMPAPLPSGSSLRAILPEPRAPPV